MAARMRKEREVGPDGWTRWVQPRMRDYKIECCDCGSTHHMVFRVVDGHVQFRAKSAPAYTARARVNRNVRRQIKALAARVA